MDRPIGNTPEVHAECEKWYVDSTLDRMGPLFAFLPDHANTNGFNCRDAWYAQRGLTRTEAKRRYISTLIETMHRYASSTPEARELVSELEFVWDQIKYNASSSSSSSPMNAVGVPPLSRHPDSSYGSIGDRLAGSADTYDRPNLRAENNGHDSRLRVLSPVSQPEEEEYYRRRRRRSTNEADEQVPDEDEDEEEEEYEEARDSLYEEAEQASTNTDTGTGTDRTDEDRSHSRRHRHHTRTNVDNDSNHHSQSNSHSNSHSISHSPRDSHSPIHPKDSRWRRRVEQALTKMTAEIAAVREQMEARTVARRRRSGIWAWLKWILWTVVRQILWDLALLGVLLIWMRMRGDRRVEDRLRTGWSEVKARLGRIKLLRRFGDAPLLP